jgi:hypothetical protein
LKATILAHDPLVFGRPSGDILCALRLLSLGLSRLRDFA